MAYYNSKVFSVAAKISFLHISWLVAIIGGPIVFFREGLSFWDKSLFFLGLLVFFWFMYFSLCIVFHRFGLRDKIKEDAFLKMSDEEKGHDIGTMLEGW